jgi:hypothetical protein
MIAIKPAPSSALIPARSHLAWTFFSVKVMGHLSSLPWKWQLVGDSYQVLNLFPVPWG